MDNVFLDFDGLSRFKDKLDDQTAATVDTLVPKTEFESFKEDVQDDIEELAQDVNNTYAKKDGDYETLGAGSATNLKGNTTSNAKFSFRTAGGSADIATGQAQLNKVRGNTIVWNQKLTGLTPSPSLMRGYTSSQDGAYFRYYWENGRNISRVFIDCANYARCIDNHKYLVVIRFKEVQGITSSDGRPLFVRVSSNLSNRIPFENFRSGFVFKAIVAVSNPDNPALTLYQDTSSSGGSIAAGGVLSMTANMFDLTTMFGAGKEPSTIEEFEAMFPEEYYPYSEPTLLSFRADGIKTVGFNQFNYATGKAKVIPNNEYQITGTYTSLSMNGETITPDSDGIFTPTQYGEVEVAGGGTNTCIHLVWSGKRNGEFEEYWESKLDHPLTQLTGKLNGEGESVVVFPDGLRSAGSVHDEIVGNKAIKRIGSVDLGTLMWNKANTVNNNYWFTANLPLAKTVAWGKAPNAICAKYVSESGSYTYIGIMGISLHNSVGQVQVCDMSYSDAETFKAAMSGVMFYYELATPEEYVLDDFQLPAGYRVDDFGTEEIYVNEGLTTPCDLDVVYGINAADTIRRLPDNYVSSTEEQDFTEIEKAQARRNIGVLSKDEAARKDGVYKEMVVGGALNLVDSSDDTVPREFSFDTAGGTSDIGTGLAVLKRLNGNTIVWNQMLQPKASAVGNGVSATFSNGTLTLEGTIGASGGRTTSLIANLISIVKGHKYLFICPSTQSDGVWFATSSSDTSDYTLLGSITRIATADKSIQSCYIGINWLNVGTSVSYKGRFQFFDLTQMFGAGNEPATVEEFEKMFPLDYYDYNAGSLLSFNGTGLKTTGFNQFDESTLILGKYRAPDNSETSNANRRCSDEYFKCFPNTNYFLGTNVAASLGEFIVVVCWYDANKEYISGVNGNNTLVTSPSNAAYFRVSSAGSSSRICINLSWSGSKNGTYEPYEEHTLNYDISAIQDGDGNQLFPLGLLSAGNVHDELTAHKAIKRVGVVDLGTLEWARNTSAGTFYAPLDDAKNVASSAVLANIICAKYQTFIYNEIYSGTKGISITGQSPKCVAVYDSAYSTTADFKTAMSGVMLYYELETPIEVDFDEQLNLSYNVNDWGTEELLPENGTTPTTSPAKFDIVYNVNAVDTLKNLSRNYLAEADLERLLTALGTALGFTYTKTWNQETKEWSFTVTPTTQGE